MVATAPCRTTVPTRSTHATTPWPGTHTIAFYRRDEDSAEAEPTPLEVESGAVVRIDHRWTR